MHANRRYRFASAREVSSPSWRDRASCRPNPDGSVWEAADGLFFPDGRSDSEWVARQTEAAKAVCAACPVLAECREYALANPSLTGSGVWGGLTETERQDLAAARRKAPTTAGREAAA
jgi:WhiB family transcriptional regulator, redox-sensing transcriptional regulator